MRFLLLLGVLLLGACTTAPDGSKTINTPTVAQVATDVSFVAGGLQKALAALPDTGITVSSDNLMVAQNAVTGLQGVAAAIAASSSTAAAQPLVPQIESYVNAFVGALGPALSVCKTDTCKTIQGYLAAANLLLPVIEIGLNMALPQPAPAQIDQARTTLAAPVK